MIGVKENAWPILLVVVAIAVTVLVLSQTSTSAGHRLTAEQPQGGVGAAASSSQALAPRALDCRGNSDDRLVKVSLGEQTLALCERNSPVAVSPVSTGRVSLGDGTPLGTWHINSRETDRYLTGPDYRVFVNYWLPFFGDFGFHDSPWQRFPYGDRTLYKTEGSRGCIHVPRPAMDKLYRWVRVGTTVTITP